MIPSQPSSPTLGVAKALTDMQIAAYGLAMAARRYLRALASAQPAPAPQETACAKCGKTRAAHCDLDEPGLDHRADCPKYHHEFKVLSHREG